VNPPGWGSQIFKDNTLLENAVKTGYKLLAEPQLCL